jgi:hypothetical protein
MCRMTAPTRGHTIVLTVPVECWQCGLRNRATRPGHAWAVVISSLWLSTCWHDEASRNAVLHMFLVRVGNSHHQATVCPAHAGSAALNALTFNLQPVPLKSCRQMLTVMSQHLHPGPPVPHTAVFYCLSVIHRAPSGQPSAAAQHHIAVLHATTHVGTTVYYMMYC